MTWGDTTRTSRLRIHFDAPGEYRVVATSLPKTNTFHLLAAHPFWFVFAGLGSIGAGLVVLAVAAIFAIFVMIKISTHKL